MTIYVIVGENEMTNNISARAAFTIARRPKSGSQIQSVIGSMTGAKSLNWSSTMNKQFATLTSLSLTTAATLFEFIRDGNSHRESYGHLAANFLEKKKAQRVILPGPSLFPPIYSSDPHRPETFC